jgi:hypothetical protein
MTAAVHFTSGGTSVITAADTTIPATQAAGVAKTRGGYRQREHSRPGFLETPPHSALSVRMALRAMQTFHPTTGGPYMLLR